MQKQLVLQIDVNDVLLLESLRTVGLARLQHEGGVQALFKSILVHQLIKKAVLHLGEGRESCGHGHTVSWLHHIDQEVNERSVLIVLHVGRRLASPLKGFKGERVPVFSKALEESFQLGACLVFSEEILDRSDSRLFSLDHVVETREQCICKIDQGIELL